MRGHAQIHSAFWGLRIPPGCECDHVRAPLNATNEKGGPVFRPAPYSQFEKVFR